MKPLTRLSCVSVTEYAALSAAHRHNAQFGRSLRDDFYRPEVGVGSGCLPAGLVQTISLQPLRVYGPEVVQAATAGLLP